jgi:hypothetical protein
MHYILSFKYQVFNPWSWPVPTKHVECVSGSSYWGRWARPGLSTFCKVFCQGGKKSRLNPILPWMSDGLASCSCIASRRILVVCPPRHNPFIIQDGGKCSASHSGRIYPDETCYILFEDWLIGSLVWGNIQEGIKCLAPRSGRFYPDETHAIYFLNRLTYR